MPLGPVGFLNAATGHLLCQWFCWMGPKRICGTADKVSKGCHEALSAFGTSWFPKCRHRPPVVPMVLVGWVLSGFAGPLTRFL